MDVTNVQFTMVPNRLVRPLIPVLPKELNSARSKNLLFQLINSALITTTETHFSKKQVQVTQNVEN